MIPRHVRLSDAVLAHILGRHSEDDVGNGEGVDHNSVSVDAQIEILAHVGSQSQHAGLAEHQGSEPVHAVRRLV